MLTVKLSKTNKNKTFDRVVPLWECPPSLRLGRKTKRHIGKNHTKECSILTGYQPFHGFFFSHFLTHLFIFPLFLFFLFLCNFALYSSMSLPYVAVSCSSWLSSLYSSSVPDLLVIQSINITILSIATVLGLGMNKSKGIWHVGTVLPYVC